jgi:hypothetical protein
MMRAMTAIKRFDVNGSPSKNFHWRRFEGGARNAVLRSGGFYALLAGFALPTKIPCYSLFWLDEFPVFRGTGIDIQDTGIASRINAADGAFQRILQKFPVTFPVLRECTALQ